MPRQLPKEWRNEAVPDITPKTNDYITQVREYELITPLFGGGVETQKADPITIVRATEVRGQLRFWWRATRGGQFGGSLKEMKQAEDAIWGNSASFDKEGKLIGGPSQVQVVVTQFAQGGQDAPFEVVRGRNGQAKTQPRNGSGVPAYAAFPLQPSEGESYVGMQTKTVMIDVRFTLAITMPRDYQTQVEAALWAWETFGGLGARTRRGFGALTCVRIDRKATERPKPQGVKKSIEDKLRYYVTANGVWHPTVPHLTQSSRIVIVDGDAEANAFDTWMRLIDKLQSFRQARAKNKYGATLWPDADAVRRATSKTPAPKNLPRAILGLPIIFHFNDPGEPENTSLQTDEHDRMASPLILRPFRCANQKDKERYVGIGIVLDTPALPPGNLELVATKDRSCPPWTVDGATLSEADARKIITPDGQSIIQNATQPNGTIDILRAFLNYLERK